VRDNQPWEVGLTGYRAVEVCAGSNRIVVLTALPLEAAAVRAHLSQPVRHDLPAGTIIEEAALPGTRYRVPGTGYRVPDLLGLHRAGQYPGRSALRDDLPLGDVVVATRCLRPRYCAYGC
jgi:hypothetical protein